MMESSKWQKVLSPIRGELDEVEQLIRETLATEVPALRAASTSLFDAGGKRLRPAFLLLAGQLTGDDLRPLLPFAAAVEIAHAATLIHDDLIDNSDLRRGRPTVKAQYGNRMAVYTGNYLFNQALALVMRHDVGEHIELLVAVSVAICRGEIAQLEQAYQIPRSARVYLERIRQKTALLIALSCQLGAVLQQASEQQTRALYRYGYYLGMAFQISDDVLDIVGTPEVIGKPAGSDLAEGMITLPVLYALQFSAQRELLARWVIDPEACRTRTEEILQLIKRSGGVRQAQIVADRYAGWARRSLNIFPDSKTKQTLLRAAQQISRRAY
jgi:heptaprenyl diphosphate synthase